MKQPGELTVRTHYVPNHFGWELELRQCYDPHRLRKDLRPIMIVPGYGMNAFIFSYHPSGASMEATWAAAGFDVWSVNLRGQGGSRRRGGSRSYDMAEVACEDIPAAIDAIRKRTVSDQKDKVDAVGASLGGTFLYAYLGLSHDPRVGSLVAIGAPLRWEKIHPVVKVAFSVPDLIGRIPFYGTQRLAKAMFPLAIRIPFVIRTYLHPELVDMDAVAELVKTIEDPVPRLNRQIGYWIRHRDMVLRDRNITRELSLSDNPLLCVIANKDGIVPKETALSGLTAMGGPVGDVIEVGDAQQGYAHADLFISKHADKKVFIPIADWLVKQSKATPRRKPGTPKKKRASS